MFRGGNEFLRLSPGEEEVVELYTGILSSWRKSIRFPPFQVRREGRRGGRGGIDETEVGIYVLYVYRSGSITDTREILTQDGIPPPINFPLMNGNGINKWLRAFRLSFPYDFRYGILDLGQRR